MVYNPEDHLPPCTFIIHKKVSPDGLVNINSHLTISFLLFLHEIDTIDTDKCNKYLAAG